MQGTVSRQGIKKFIKDGIIISSDINEDSIQPASIDLRVGSYAYRVPASFLLNNQYSVSERLKEFEKDYYKINIEHGGFLEARKTYVFELQEELNLPPYIFAVSSPKSSTGRVDTFARLITDRGTTFDRVRKGYKGKLYLVVFPMSFDLIVRRGLALNQLRFFSHENAFLNTEWLKDVYETHQLLYDSDERPIPLDNALIKDNGLFLSIDLSGDIVGYRSKKHTKPIDLSNVGGYKVSDYWEPIHKPEDKRLILDPDYFYILKSKEKIRIPPTYSAEMVAFESGIGEFRTHYAGFFDPGFGYGNGEIKGAVAICEVRIRDTPMEVEDGQTFVKMVFQKMMEKPDVIYGAGEVKSNYQKQEGIKLGKHFRH